MSFTFNATRLTTKTAQVFRIPLWNQPLGRLLRLERHENEIILRFEPLKSAPPCPLCESERAPPKEKLPVNYPKVSLL